MRRRREGQISATTTSRESSESRSLSLRERLTTWLEDSIIGEGLDTDYDWAPSVISHYRGPLPPSSDYVAMRRLVREEGLESLLERNGASYSDGKRHRIGLRRRIT